VLVVDPPWPYASSELPYPTMPLEEISALPVGELLDEDAVLWLWTTNAFLRSAFAIAEESWQLEVRSILTWAKDRVGKGSWLRGQTEHCLFCSRGHPLIRLGSQSTLLQGRAREHSRKPEEFYELVQSLCPGRKLELFAREPRPGWARWGAETEKFAPGEAEEQAA
jgi:N6-adenosine-specific RNA methylase IME4